MKTAEEMRTRLIDRAGEDEAFRSRLLSDPKGAIQDELDVSVPDDFEVNAHEDNRGIAHLVLPPHPRLTEAEMTEGFGGRGYREGGRVPYPRGGDWTSGR